MMFAELLRQAFYPVHCCICHTPGSAFCVECAPFVHERRDEYLADAAVPLRCLGAYQEQLRRAVLEIKNGRRDVASAAAAHLADRLSDLVWIRGAMLIPMPTASHRVRLRGMDGAAVLASAIATRLDLGSLQVLYSTSTIAQHERNRNERLTAKPRLGVHARESIVGVSVVLVDDVVTTGATLREAASLLRDCGANVCGALALARTLDTLQDGGERVNRLATFGHA